MDKNFTFEEQITIRYLREKLDWYCHEASDFEYDSKRVKTMLSLLKQLDPPNFAEDDFTPEKALERFWKTQELREQIHEEMERMKGHGLRIIEFPGFDEIDARLKEETAQIEKKKKPFKHRKISAIITAAALVIMISLSVTVGAFAERMGYFFRIADTENKEVVFTMSDQAEHEHYRYSDFEEIPIQYTRYIWVPNAIPDNMALKYIDIYDNISIIEVNTRYQYEDYFLDFNKKTYAKDATYSERILDSFELIQKQQVEGTDIEVKYLVKENDDYNEYIVTFYYKNSFYFIDSNLDYSAVANIADSYLSNLK